MHPGAIEIHTIVGGVGGCLVPTPTLLELRTVSQGDVSCLLFREGIGPEMEEGEGWGAREGY